MKTKLDQLYSLRKNFTIIGLTGRTGSGCTELSEELSKDFSELENLRKPSKISTSVSQKKYEITYQFTSKNWKKYKVIEYKKVLFLLLLPRLIKKENDSLLFDYYRNYLKDEPDKAFIAKLKNEIKEILQDQIMIVARINQLGDIAKLKDEDQLKILNEIFWDNPSFKKLSEDVDKKLRENGFTERIMLLHHIANNFRKSKEPFKTDVSEPQNIYYLARVINKIIKATRSSSQNNECHIVIDSLRNSLEINFFKERYSAFYLVAVKSDRRKTRLIKSYPELSEEIIDRVLDMDDVEYKGSDFQKGLFYVPDVQNCIQFADYHLNHMELPSNDKNNWFDSFYSATEQLIKLQGLIQQPGLITPEPSERIMQIAFSARLNSGCISRQVGAAVTDSEFSLKALGWNDVPKGAVPCSLRDVKELLNPINSFGFTEFEKGKGLKETENIQNEDYKDNEIDIESREFHNYVITNYNEETLNSQKLGGRSCPFCFKQAYNNFSGEKNQVHTRSLHAEENAMMQISKYGGQGLKNGYLFTTASPCELCAKKAYQLGIKTIYFIDPYPGISRNHILKSSVDSDPKMTLFSGAVGRAYHKLYEPFMSQKDELALLTDFKAEEPQQIKAKKLRGLLASAFQDKKDLKEQLDTILKDDSTIFDKVITLIEKGLSSK